MLLLLSFDAMQLVSKRGSNYSAFMVPPLKSKNLATISSKITSHLIF